MITDESEYPRRYLQFPLFLVKGMFTNKVETINQILNFGIYKYSQAIKYDLTNVARQVIYRHYRGDLNHEIWQQIQKHNIECIGFDEDYKGFVNGLFEATDEVTELLTIFEADTKLKDLCIEQYCIWQAFEWFALKGNSISIAKIGKQIQKQIPKREVMPMLAKHILMHYRDNDKTEFEIAQLLSYVAVKSTIGKSGYAKTNKQHIVSRMFGYASIKSTNGQTITDMHKKYLNRYHIDKVLTKLQLDWNVCVYANNLRGMYVSVKSKIPLDKLVIIAEQKKESNRIKELKKQKCSIISAALKATT